MKILSGYENSSLCDFLVEKGVIDIDDVDGNYEHVRLLENSDIKSIVIMTRYLNQEYDDSEGGIR